MATSADALVDTSVAIPYLVASHPDHRRIFDAMKDLRRGLSGHAAFETFSLLTRLPGDVKVDAVTAGRVIEAEFPVRAYLSVRTSSAMLDRLAREGIAGGAVYDALVGAAAVEHGLPLYSRDRRALGIYQKLGVDVRLLD